jgi:hypothetical protein
MTASDQIAVLMRAADEVKQRHESTYTYADRAILQRAEQVAVKLLEGRQNVESNLANRRDRLLRRN